jgi:hypothetical protein
MSAPHPPHEPAAPGSGDIRGVLGEYEAARARYDDMNHQINALFAQFGTSDRMPAEAIARYRQLQHARDDAYNTMRALESPLFGDEGAGGA